MPRLTTHVNFDFCLNTSMFDGKVTIHSSKGTA